jgi:hypothetical protein
MFVNGAHCVNLSHYQTAAQHRGGTVDPAAREHFCKKGCVIIGELRAKLCRLGYVRVCE